MEDLEKPSVNPVNYRTYTLDKYLIIYNADMDYEVFSCEQYYGITFFAEDGKYDAFCNKDMGCRITYNLKDGHWHDIPFKPETFGFLPQGVKVIEIG
jgi:hypothetical protein